jgi:glutamate carboxypeptidase
MRSRTPGSPYDAAAKLDEDVRAVRDDLRESLPRLEHDLAELVAVDSGTYTPAGVRRMLAIMGRHLKGVGFEVAGASGSSGGLVATYCSPSPGPKLLIVGHVDTVFDAGTAASRPLAVVGGLLTGAGVADMKGSLALMMHVLASLTRLFGAPVTSGEIVVVLSVDEEIGSPTGGPVLARAAEGATAALVLEPSRPSGDLVLERKGMAQARLTARGRAAHSGVDPELGRSALLALAHATIRLNDINDPGLRTTCNVGSLHAGTRANVIPDEATLDLDLRAPELESFARGIKAIEAVVAEPAIEDVSIEITWRGRYPPMSATPESSRLLELARRVGRALGLSIHGVATGGASDANAIAALGVPVLDGLGPIGGGAHTSDEYVDLDSLPERGALLAGMLLGLSREDQRGRGGGGYSAP